MVVTVLVWTAFYFTFSIILPLFPNHSKSLQIQTGTIWSMYVVLIDNLVSLIFMKQVFKARRLMLSTKNDELARKVVKSVVLLTAAVWICVALALLAGFGAKTQHARQFIYRLSFSFSTLMYSGSLYFIFSIRKLIPEKKVEEEPIDLRTKYASSMIWESTDVKKWSNTYHLDSNELKIMENVKC